jgi:hypothetical protein
MEMSAVRAARESAGKVAQEMESLSGCLFDRARSWKVVSGERFADGQLLINAANINAVEVEWTSEGGVRPDKTAPTSIRLLVPPSEVVNRSAWDFKAELLTNFMSTKAGSAREPLSTEFLQSLVEKGYTISSISNASVSDAKLSLKLASCTTLEKVDLNAALTLQCDTLYLTDVNISNCHLTFAVGGGTWSNVLMSGDKTALMGQLGETVMDEKCVFDSGYLAADFRNGHISTSNLRERMKTMIYEGQLMPTELRPYLGTPLTPEQVAAMNARIASFKPQQINAAEWQHARDLGSV